MTANDSQFIDRCRTRARAIKARHDELGIPVTLAQAYELLAAADGHRTWAAMRASGAVAMEEASDDHLPEHSGDSGGFVTTLAVTRRVSLDARTAGSLRHEELLVAAHAELSYVLMDGEDYPPMRFKGMRNAGDDMYSFFLDIDVPETVEDVVDYLTHAMRLAERDNVVSWRFVDWRAQAGKDLPTDANFKGSDGRRGEWNKVTVGFSL